MAKIERGKNFPGLIKLEDRNILIHWELDKNLKGTVISLKPCETDEILKKAVFAICKKYFRKHLITLWRWRNSSFSMASCSLSLIFIFISMNEFEFLWKRFWSPWRKWTFYRGDKTEFLYWQSPRFFRLHVPIKQDFWIDQKDSPHLRYKEIKYHTISCHFQKLCH